ncbi:DUF6447 family protein [Marinomonas gallaica]|uniref:DUF6447 family protein n=1 Tax=Marinomonas gallaica TaxID=1806667 RepID=UPI000833481D|nr:DUF6447 family protein [Marinomonas gallaica]
MATLTVEGKQFDINELSEEAKSCANSVSFCDNRISQLEAELTVVKMARHGFVQRLVAALPNVEDKTLTTKAVTKKRTTRKAENSEKSATGSSTGKKTTTTRKRATTTAAKKNVATTKKTTSPTTRKASAKNANLDSGPITES